MSFKEQYKSRWRYWIPPAGAGISTASRILACMTLSAVSNVSVVLAATEHDLATARNSLRAAHDAVSSATAEFKTLQDTNSLTRVETADFQAYLERLKQVLETNCRTVLNLKQELDYSGGLSSEPECDARLPAPSAPVDFPDEQTEAEVTASLDHQLNASLSEFDELLLKEMEALKQRQSGSPDAASSGSGGGAGGQGGSDQGSAGQSDAADSEGDGADSDQSAGQQGGEGQQTQQGQVAARSPSGADQQGESEQGNPDGESRSTPTQQRDRPPAAADDDIVARQLREAAENEPDPELREKLWEEYRRYKENQSANSAASRSKN